MALSLQIFRNIITIFAALPRSPSNVRVSDVQPTSVRLSWSYDGDVQSEVQYSTVQYSTVQYSTVQYSTVQ